MLLRKSMAVPNKNRICCGLYSGNEGGTDRQTDGRADGTGHNNTLRAEGKNGNQNQLDVLTACQCLKLPRSLSGTPTHPSKVTHYGHEWSSHIPLIPLSRSKFEIVLSHEWEGWLTWHVNQPSHSWDKTISNFDLENSRPRSWACSKGMVT